MRDDLVDRGAALGGAGGEGFLLGLGLLGFEFGESLVGILEQLPLFSGHLLDFAAEIQHFQLVHIVDPDQKALELRGPLLAIGDAEGLGQFEPVDLIPLGDLVRLGDDLLIRHLDRGLVCRGHLELGDGKRALVLGELGFEGRDVGRRRIPFRQLRFQFLGFGFQGEAGCLLGLEFGAESLERAAVGRRGIDFGFSFLRCVDRQTEVCKRRLGVGEFGLDLGHRGGHGNRGLRHDLRDGGWRGHRCRRAFDGLHPGTNPGRKILWGGCRGFGDWGLDGGGYWVRYGHGVSI